MSTGITINTSVEPEAVHKLHHLIHCILTAKCDEHTKVVALRTLRTMRMAGYVHCSENAITMAPERPEAEPASPNGTKPL